MVQEIPGNQRNLLSPPDKKKGTWKAKGNRLDSNDIDKKAWISRRNTLGSLDLGGRKQRLQNNTQGRGRTAEGGPENRRGCSARLEESSRSR